MILEISGDGLMIFIVGIYLLAHSPAIVCIIVGLFIRKNKPHSAKVLFIIAGVYFLIGTGICGALMSG